MGAFAPLHVSPYLVDTAEPLPNPDIPQGLIQPWGEPTTTNCFEKDPACPVTALQAPALAACSAATELGSGLLFPINIHSPSAQALLAFPSSLPI